MDAQNAVESTSAKQAASPKRVVSELDISQPIVNVKSPLITKPIVPTKDSKSAPSLSNVHDGDTQVDRDSDAETIVLPGREGISPSKPRKVIKHEDKSDGEVDDVPTAPRKIPRDGKDGKDGGKSGGAIGDVAFPLAKKKRLEKDKSQPHSKDGSSGLSSAPTSPPGHRRNHSSSHRQRRAGDALAESDSESSKPRSPKLTSKDKAKSVDRVLSNKRKTKAESDDENESPRIRKPRVSDASIESKYLKDHKSSHVRPHHDKPPNPRTRSVSPHGRTHRRSVSSQLPSISAVNGLSTKKRRIPAPLQATDYHSDDSSTSGSPHPRSSRLKSIATPVTGDSTVSPAKMPPHKKHVDSHGQTLLAKACAKGEYDMAKMRLQERPEDLNYADHAGNAPLQVAALNGHEDIVSLLIGAGCNLECRNGVKDTPLHDAVENGHLEVVKLLLAAGVNPRKANQNGDTPMDVIPDDLDNADEIRAALEEAKQKMGELRRTSEPHDAQDPHDSSHGPDSPRRSPPASVGGVIPPRRGGTVRSTKTSNHLLYMNLDDKTLRQAATRGDSETVSRILQVKEDFDDAEALVGAARGGHSIVMQLLLAVGGANPDPSPVKTLPTEHSTPMLAAIGGENIEVVELLIGQSNFDPTRKFKGETYYEIARRRAGPMWEQEEDILKKAYDAYKKSHPGSVKKSPSRPDRDQQEQGQSKRSRNESSHDAARSHKRRPSSQSRDRSRDRENEPKKKATSNKVSASPKEKRRSLSFSNQDDQLSAKRGPGRPKKEDRFPTVAVSDREASPANSTKTQPTKPKPAESDVAGSSDGETARPRKKLISGKDLKSQREKQRRTSMASINSQKDAADRTEAKHDESPEKSRSDRISEKYHDRTKALKRDESRDRHSGNDGPGKRHRSSVTPPRNTAGDKDDNEAPSKRRRLDADGRERRTQQNSSEDRARKRDVSRDSVKRQKLLDNERKDPTKLKKVNRDRREPEKSSPSEKGSITVFSENMDVDMRDAPLVADEREAQAERDGEREREESRKRQADLEAAQARRWEEEQRLQEERKQKRDAEEKREQEEAEKRRTEEKERQRKEKEAQKRKEEEKAKLDEERKHRAEEERKRREEEERKQREEEERKRGEEEERVRREQEAAAEEARKCREEEIRKERERKRAAFEAEQVRVRQEQEKLRLAKLPPLLRWLEGCPDPKQREFAELFATVQGVRWDTIRPEATGTPEGREQWLLNTQVALLLGEKDLTLQRYSGWQHMPVSDIAKRVIWRVEQERYALTEGKLYHLGAQLPDDYYGGDPYKVGYKKLEELRSKAAELFFETDMFFVKESDFLYIVSTIPHLRDVKLSIWYRELPETEAQSKMLAAPAKWKKDPDAATREGFAPRQKYYINGSLIGEARPGHYKPSKTPFPEQRIPRRNGIVAIGPEEPDYVQLCVQQNLGHLLTEQQKASIMNGAHLTPRSMTSNDTAENGENLSPSAVSPTIRVNGTHGLPPKENPLVNGINGTDHI